MIFRLHRLTMDGVVTEEFTSATDTLARMSELGANSEGCYVVKDGADLDMAEVEKLALRENDCA